MKAATKQSQITIPPLENGDLLTRMELDTSANPESLVGFSFERQVYLARSVPGEER